jgi:chromosome segregation ATPase
MKKQRGVIPLALMGTIGQVLLVVAAAGALYLLVDRTVGEHYREQGRGEVQEELDTKAEELATALAALRACNELKTQAISTKDAALGANVELANAVKAAQRANADIAKRAAEMKKSQVELSKTILSMEARARTAEKSLADLQTGAISLEEDCRLAREEFDRAKVK